MSSRHGKLENGFSAVELIFIIVIVGILAAIGWHVWQSRQTNNGTASGSTVSAPISQAFKSGGVTVDYVNMSGLKDKNAGNINGISENNGHFVYGDAKVVCSECAESYWGKGKVIYDGQVVYTGDLDSASVRLSDNGLHYTYAVPGSSGKSEKFYLDKNYLPTSPSMIIGSSLIAVSDNGQDYAYANGSGLYVDSRLKYAIPQSFLVDETLFGANLADYISGILTGAESTDGGIESVVYDGKTITSSGESGDMQMNISNNGQHYIYTTNGVLVHDGQQLNIDNTQKVASVTIADSGDYAFVECNSSSGANTVYIDARTYSNGNCNGNNTSRLVPTLLSDDGTHYFYFTNNQAGTKAVLDGKSISLSGQVDNASFSGDTLYIYRWVN